MPTTLHQLKAKHGMTGTPVYECWKNMRRRCYSPNTMQYADYGGRGIKVCVRWQKFENFLEDMGQPPKGLTLDRKDNDGDYTPDNCRWATRTEQKLNQRMSKRNTSGTVGVYWHKINQQWEAKIKPNGVLLHLGSFLDKGDAVRARQQAELKYWSKE